MPYSSVGHAQTPTSVNGDIPAGSCCNYAEYGMSFLTTHMMIRRANSPLPCCLIGTLSDKSGPYRYLMLATASILLKFVASIDLVFELVRLSLLARLSRLYY
jgi:hypothetical protein